MDYHNKKHKKNRNYRGNERRSLIIVSIVIGLMAFVLLNNFEKKFTNVERAYNDKSILNLDKNLKADDLTDLLLKGNYFSEKKDAELISGLLTEQLQKEPLPNLGILNKNKFRIDATYADSIGGPELKSRVENSLQILGYTPEIESLYKEGATPLNLKIDDGNHTVSVKVEKGDKTPSKGIIVRFQQFYIPEESFDYTDTCYYAATNADGIAIFSGIKDSTFFSVLPICKGYEYGASKGTTSGGLIGNKTYTFIEKKHTIRLLGNITYAQLKEDEALTVRTPTDFINSFISYLILFFVSWWIVHFWFIIRKKNSDELLLPILMALSGICVVMMYAIHNPLTDLMQGSEMAIGVAAGCLAILIFSEINLVTSYVRDKFLFFPGKFKLLPSALFLFAVFILIFLLIIFGTGPEGSGVKVNLFFFQPSEIIKYLIIIFFADFFSRKADLLTDIPTFSWEYIKVKFKSSGIVFIVMFILLFVYLLLGDMGPALVVCSTFIIIYSIARGDFLQLVIAVLTYSLLIWGVSYFINSGPGILLLFSGLWMLCWIIFSVLKKNFYESGLFAVLVLAAFIFGEHLPGVGDRLKSRNEIYENIWDNQVYGGDQIVQGVWSLATGGITGQGLGEGSPNVVPAFHTDMIFTSIGEELGILGLLLIILCLAILIHRTLLIGRKAAHPFAFYIAAGVAIVTGVQFLIIAGGSLGLIPLTGVTVPFLSYGKVSMIINLASFGIIISVSRLSGSDRQKKAIRKSYDNTVAYTMLTYCVFSLVILIALFKYQVFNPDEYLIKPAFVSNRAGERIASYNPRINLLMKKLQAGNIYDRNNLLLATSRKELIENSKQDLIYAGVNDAAIKKELSVRKRRYYPFGADMFFWVGDYNTRLLWSDGEQAKGFLAECRHLSDLRGFNTRPNEIEKSSEAFKVNRFVPSSEDEFKLIVHDYSELIPLLKAGLNSSKVKEFNKISRDITLTVDAVLQTRLQNELRFAFTNGNYKRHSRSRTSVVILNSKNGEVLTSANYPLPDEAQLKLLYEIPVSDRRRAMNTAMLNGSLFTDADLGTTYATPPGSTAKLISSLSGFRKLGKNAARVAYPVSMDERFRVGGGDPDPVGMVDMERAIVHSSNVYFIKLINEERLDQQLSDIYLASGIKIAHRSTPPFYNTYNEQQEEELRRIWQTNVFNKNRNSYNNKNLPPKTRLQSEFSYLAWGQGQMDATPLSMARVVSAIANKGELEPSKYILSSSQKLDLPSVEPVNIVTSDCAGLLKGYMEKQSQNLVRRNNLGITLYGKTGTPQRIVPGNKNNFDGWYVFFVDSSLLNEPVSVAIRIERAGSSAVASRLAADVVIPVLRELRYID